VRRAVRADPQRRDLPLERVQTARVETTGEEGEAVSEYIVRVERTTETVFVVEATDEATACSTIGERLPDEHSDDAVRDVEWPDSVRFIDEIDSLDVTKCEPFPETRYAELGF
jgi:hypothetical protein